MKTFRKRIRLFSFVILTAMMTIASISTNASASIGAIEKNSYPISQPTQNNMAAATVSAALVAGVEVGGAIGLTLGFFARLGYEYVTSLIGAEIAASLAELNYDPNNLERFDNPKN